MNQTKLRTSLSGLALMLGLITGMALATVPSAAPEGSPSMEASAGKTELVVEEGDVDNALPRPRICTYSCRDCLLTPCGPDEGTCANTLCASAN